jgi:hypothetical protein
VDSLNTTDANYVWYDGGDGRSVSYSASDGDYQLSGSTTFNVKRPTDTTAVSISSVNSATTIDTDTGQGLEVHCGLADAQHACIRFSRISMTIPSGFTGDTEWVQLITRTTSVNGETPVTLSGLDDIYPYNPPWDSPGGSLLSGNSSITIDDTWKMYLLFKPGGDDSSYVPLRRIDWRWSAAATQTNSIWSITSHTNPQDGGQPTDVDETQIPTWTRIVHGTDLN